MPWEIRFDTRLGYGFRLGPHADFQTLVEIGPQLNTNPISTNGTVAKRQSLGMNRLQRLYLEAQKKAGRKVKSNVEKKDAGKMKKPSKPTESERIEFPNKVLQTDGIGDKKSTEIPTKQVKSTTESTPTRFSLLQLK
ncbi:conserved hypothetical protein [Pediculus humanus corporis]|uniref:Uncharacterized protein n=1 Tax=Pediculus humanus subsp. corporis TaxID=121224 RepID=E0VPW9_PEDHC|nr:uncharacterized protein Phum_PHUM366750 [Pediculus humanus corporis]EEB15425.1 conserved hypothetical protein [Pediculus humanus corporis]